MSAPTVRFERLPPWKHAQAWPDIADFVDSVTEHVHGEWTTDQMKADIISGRYSLILLWDEQDCVGVIVYSMQNRKNDRTAFIALMAGRHIIAPENWEYLKELFRAEGATAVEAAMRPSMVRLCRKMFTPKFTIVGAQI